MLRVTGEFKLSWSSLVAWSVERLLHKKCHLLVVDRIPLVDIYMVKILKGIMDPLLRLRGL